MTLPCLIVRIGMVYASNEITSKIIGAAIEVHRVLGPGLLESVYEHCLVRELQAEGLRVSRQLALPLVYKGETLEGLFRLDLVVEDQVIVEIKAVEALNEVHLAQVITYLKLTNLSIGLLINFNVALLKQGIRRVVNNHPE